MQNIQKIRALEELSLKLNPKNQFYKKAILADNNLIFKISFLYQILSSKKNIKFFRGK